MIIHGGGEIRGGNVSSCNDHRIVMSAAIVGLQSTSKVIIEDAQVVNKSYPDFFKDISSVFKIK
jgi:3-phosphoshikimate 1-carboxyvinyltransferase